MIPAPSGRYFRAACEGRHSFPITHVTSSFKCRKCIILLPDCGAEVPHVAIYSRVIKVKFCPFGQGEIRLVPGAIGSLEPVKLLRSARSDEISQPGGLPFSITTADRR